MFPNIYSNITNLMGLISTNIKLSVGLVTRNRSESLLRTLQSIRKQSYQPYEIIVSDDSNLPNEIIANKELCLRYNCIYLSGPQNGLYSNRNFVAKKFNGTHLRTMDDDHEFPMDHFKKCIQAIMWDNEAIWTIGEYFPNDTERPLPGPLPGQLHPRGYAVAPVNFDNYYGISCGATIYPLTVIKQNILNNESYKFGILYLEYGARLFSKGFHIKHLDSTYVIHHSCENDVSISSRNTINCAKIFSMLMFSFKLTNSFINKLQTIIQLFFDIITRKYSVKLLIDVYKKYKKESALLK